MRVCVCVCVCVCVHAEVCACVCVCVPVLGVTHYELRNNITFFKQLVK